MVESGLRPLRDLRERGLSPGILNRVVPVVVLLANQVLDELIQLELALRFAVVGPPEEAEFGFVFAF
jgi:hypothetical protein